MCMYMHKFVHVHAQTDMHISSLPPTTMIKLTDISAIPNLIPQSQFLSNFDWVNTKIHL